MKKKHRYLVGWDDDGKGNYVYGHNDEGQVRYSYPMDRKSASARLNDLGRSERGYRVIYKLVPVFKKK